MKLYQPKLFLFSKKRTSKPQTSILGSRFYKPRSFKFRSFFAFLKPKPFVINLRNLFCKTFLINPRNRTLSGVIKNTKKFSTLNLQNYFNTRKTSIKPIISSLTLQKLTTKLSKKIRAKTNFVLFKHKIYNYTTPKSNIYQHLADVTRLYPVGLDFRVG
jgi:hypothetical protein